MLPSEKVENSTGRDIATSFIFFSPLPYSINIGMLIRARIANRYPRERVVISISVGPRPRSFCASEIRTLTYPESPSMTPKQGKEPIEFTNEYELPCSSTGCVCWIEAFKSIYDRPIPLFLSSGSNYCLISYCLVRLSSS